MTILGAELELTGAPEDSTVKTNSFLELLSVKVEPDLVEEGRIELNLDNVDCSVDDFPKLEENDNMEVVFEVDMKLQD